jgi:hypothetical protein
MMRATPIKSLQPGEDTGLTFITDGTLLPRDNDMPYQTVTVTIYDYLPAGNFKIVAPGGTVAALGRFFLRTVWAWDPFTDPSLVPVWAMPNANVRIETLQGVFLLADAYDIVPQ